MFDITTASHATPARIDGSTQVESSYGHSSPLLIDASTQSEPPQGHASPVTHDAQVLAAHASPVHKESS
eukprot:8007954-Karenia_brevis.AAC.1